MPDKVAPKHSPVDIAPQPEYKSNKLNSFFAVLESSSTASFELWSLEIVDEVSLPVPSFCSSKTLRILKLKTMMKHEL